MKLRMTIFVVGLLFLVSGIGFAAQDIGNGFSLENRVFVGLQAVTEEDGDDDVDNTKVSARNDGEGAAARVQFNINYANEDFGAKFRVRANFGDGGPGILMQYGYFWQNLFANKFTIWGGYFAAATEIYGNGKAGIPVLDTESGECDRAFPQIKLEVKPIDGLSVGLMIPIRAGQEGSEFFRSLTFGAYYTNDIFRVVGEVGLKPETVSSTSGTDGYYRPDASGNPEWVLPVAGTTNKTASRVEANFGIGATFAPIQFSITGKYASNPKASNDYTGNRGNGFFAIAPKVVFNADALQIYGQSVLGFSNEEKQNIDGGLWGDAFKGVSDPKIKADEKITAVCFELGASYVLNDTFTPYFAIGSDRVNYFAGNGLYVKPGVKIIIGSKANINIWDQINGIGADKEIGGKNYSAIKNTLQIDLSFSL
ncbi:hypothetical protein FACS1894172_06410 [Spirochaetia bacterium]|nr:hypothetical protein FACS1894172_06410 [Spirochaetia bacterium]